MTLVMALWVLAMLAGLSAPRWLVGVCTLSAVTAFVWLETGHLGAWHGWVELSTVALTPWLLAAQRQSDELAADALKAQEALGLSRLAESARALLALQHASQRLDAQLAEMTEVYNVTKHTSGALRLPELFTALLDVAPRLLNGPGLRLLDLSGKAPQVLRASRGADGRMMFEDSRAVQPVEQVVLERVRVSGVPSALTAAEALVPLPAGITQLSWAPLWREQRLIGVLIADDLPDGQERMLVSIANQLSLQLSRIRLYEQVEALAVTDALTGVFVRNHFMERARDELARCKRHGLSAALLMADLDHFKQKNDTYGHLVGDVVLKDVAKLLARNLRDVDLIARFGGEEFILLLVETPAEQAMPVAQRLKQLVEVHPIRAYDELLSQTISVGVAGFPEDAETLEALIERADLALYAAKRSGRNRVVRWTPSLEPSPAAAAGQEARG